MFVNKSLSLRLFLLVVTSTILACSFLSQSAQAKDATLDLSIQCNLTIEANCPPPGQEQEPASEPFQPTTPTPVQTMNSLQIASLTLNGLSALETTENISIRYDIDAQYRNNLVYINTADTLAAIAVTLLLVAWIRYVRSVNMRIDNTTIRRTKN